MIIAGGPIAGAAIAGDYEPLVLATETLRKTDLIPKDAKEAIQTFIKDTFDDLWKTIQELVDIQPPTEIAEYWDIFLQIIQAIL